MEKKLTDVLGDIWDEEIIEISDIDIECPIDELTIKRIQVASLRKVGLKSEVSTVENSKRKPYAWKKTAVAAASFVIVLTVMVTTGTFTSSAKFLASLWTSRINIGDGSREIILNPKVGVIHIKEDAPKKDMAEISLKQVEDMLGIDLLSSPMYSSDVLNYRPLIPDKDIERVDLWYPACVVYENNHRDINTIGNNENDKYISGDIILFTDKAGESVIPNEDIDAAGGKELSQTYKSSTLNTTVILYRVKWSQTRLTAVFDYKNVHYTFIGSNVSETEMIKFIDSLK